MKHTIGKNMTKEPIMIGPRVTLKEAQEVMNMWGMRHLPVANDDNKLIGIISDRDLAKAYSYGLQGDVPVTDIMAANPYSVLPHTSVGEVAEVMAENKYGCAVIVNIAGEVQGIFTTTDGMYILAKIMKDPDDANFRVLRLEDYLRNYRHASGS